MTDEPFDINEASAKLQQANAERRARAKNEPNDYINPDQAASAGETAGLHWFTHPGPFSLNGYVEIPDTHPLFKVEYSECPIKCGESWCEHSPEAVIRVHGGITYAGLSHRNTWIFGFDTAHAEDWTPLWDDGEIRSSVYVEWECQQMAKQLAAYVLPTKAAP